MKKSQDNSLGVDSTLQDLRDKIDFLDRDLVKNLNERARLVKAVGEWKHQKNAPIHDPEREAQVLAHVKAQNAGPLSNEFLMELFNDLVKRFREWERETCSPTECFPELENKKVLVVGLGLMGSSCVLRLRKKIPNLDLRGIDPKPPAKKVLDQLTDYSTILPTPETLRLIDLIVLAMPIQPMLEFISAIGPRLKKGCLIVDMGSTKKTLCDTVLNSLSSEISFVGLHPMVGGAGGGSNAASSELFSEQKILITIPRQIEKNAVLSYREFVRALGGLGIEISADLHDQVLAMTSHMPQFLSTALTLTANDFFKNSLLPQAVPLTMPQAAPPSVQQTPPLIFGPAFRDMTRLATSEYSMWKDIASTNSKNILQTIALFKTKLKAIEAKILTGDFQVEFDEAKAFRTKL
jgi:prephenate dehydrogenase